MLNTFQETKSEPKVPMDTEPSVARPTVFVVDDEKSMRKSLCWLFESVKLQVRSFADANEFLESYDRSQSGCVVLDVRMPGMSGLELQEKLRAERIEIPIVFLTGFADVPMAVRGMEGGAVHFLEKPVSDQVLLEHVHRALEIDQRNRASRLAYQEIAERIDSLTPRELEVLKYVVKGDSSRDVAAKLEISFKTVEAHRARIMKKMEAHGVAELIRMWLKVFEEDN